MQNDGTIVTPPSNTATDDHQQKLENTFFDKSPAMKDDIPKSDGQKPADDKVVPPDNTKVEPPADNKDKKVEPPADDKSKNEPLKDSKELKIPENSSIDDEALERIASFAKEQGLSKDKAQALLELEAKSLTAFETKQRESLMQMRKEWVEQVKTDKEIGGDNFNQSVELARRGLEKFATPEFIKGLTDTGFGDHPEVVRVFARIGKLIGNDKIIMGSSSQGKKLEDIFYKTKE